MKTKRTSKIAMTDRARTRVHTLASYLCFGVLFSILVASAFYTASSASSDNNVTNAAFSAKAVTHNEGVTEARSRSSVTRWLAPLSPLAPPSPDVVATYEVVTGACTNTLKDSFNLGEDVCVKASADLSGRRLSIDGTDGTVAALVDVTTDPQELILTLPSTTTSVVNGEVIDNRGIWRATVHSSADFGGRATAFFSVTDPANAAADLVIFADSTAADTVAPGDPTSFLVYLRNDGPNPAAAVHVTQSVPANMTFDSATAVTGTAFTCAESGGIVDCTPTGNLASGAISSFTLDYTVSAGAPNAILTTEVDINSTTTDPHPTSNSATARLEIRAAGSSSATCALACPLNRTVGANTTNQNNDPGAIVNFASDIESSGDCGTVTSSPASGTFFGLGTTTVNVSSATGGGNCSFTITVVQTAAPTITCAADQSATTSGSSNEASVTVNPPSFTGTNAILTGVRNDNRSLSDGYPIGTTTITWTATECNQPVCDETHPNDPNARSASCAQKIIVTSPDAPTIICPSDKSFNASGCGGTTLTAAQIGPGPTATGTHVTVEGVRSDHLNLYSDPYPPGQTTITWTATECFDFPTCTDPGARSVSCTQIITVTTTGSDTTPPTFTTPLPPDLNVTTTTCSALLDDELGVVEATDTCSSVNIKRTGVPLTVCILPNICPIDCSAQFGPGKTCNENFNFPVGTTNVVYTATDAAGNQATFTQHVTVRETTPPVFTFVPGNVGPLYTGSGATSCDTFVGDATLGTATISDNCDTTVIRTGVPAGNIFPVGNTTITYTAKADLSVTATQIVTVVDNTPPTITAPADSSAFADANCQAPVPDYRPGTVAADNCGSVTLSQSPAPGTLVGFGPHNVVVTADDGHGNTANDTVVFTVNDNTPPTITAPVDSSAFADANCQAPVPDYRPGTIAADNCGSVTLSQSPAPGTLVGFGPHNVVVTADDGHGNTNSDTVVFTVNDNTPPVFTSCPSNITLEPTCPTGAKATWAEPTATDNCGVPAVTRTPLLPLNGAVFPIGTTTLTYTADDGHGNTATCSFTVTVKTALAVVEDLKVRVAALQPPLTGQQAQGLQSKLEAARLAIIAEQTNVACNKLADFILQVQGYINNGKLTSAQGQPLIDSAAKVRNTIGCTSNPCT